MVKTSVIIPTYKRPHLLPKAVESARDAGTNIEIIVVDDASSDETAAVCRRLEGIRHIRLERNQGVAGARNVGLLNCKGEYVCFLDDDDLRLPGSLDLQARILDDHPEAGFVCGAMIMADQNYRPTGETTHPGHPSGDVFWNILELDFPVMGLSALIRKTCFLRAGLFSRQLHGIDDWDMFTRLAELYPALILDQPIGIYREPTWNSGQGSSARAKQLSRAVSHQSKLLRLPRAAQAAPAKRRAVRRRMINRVADTLLWNAARRIPSGEFRPSLSNILVALRLNPLRALRPVAYKKLTKTLLSKIQADGN